jgi:hypothetical protein
LQWHDNASAFGVSINPSRDETFKMAGSAPMELGEFLSRPKIIHRVTWPNEAEVNVDIDPWNLYLKTPEILRKIENFAYFRADMRIKVTVAGTPFHYGRCIGFYKPLRPTDSTDLGELTDKESVMMASQRMHFYINPTESAGGELLAPFFWPRPYFDLTSNALSSMGRFCIRSITPLHHANEDAGGIISPVDMTVYAWLENVELKVPTNKPIYVTPEAVDEYDDDGPVSKPAAAISAASGVMSSILPPWLKPYALATSVASGAVSTMAKMFGYSRPPVLEKKEYFTPEFVGNLSNTDQPETVHKLSLDSKQELTIDPRTVGLNACDELAIANLVQKETYFHTAPWSPVLLQGDTIFKCNVHPNIVEDTLDDGQIRYMPTVMSAITSMFKYWRGSIKYRFTIVASKYHRGRLRVAWDPKGVPGETTVAMSKIIDISQETDFEFTVGYGQDVSYLPTFTFPFPRLFGLGADDFLEGTNGTLTIDIVDSLAAPGDSDPVYILCFASAGDDFELALPTDQVIADSTFFKDPPIPIAVRNEAVEVGVTDQQQDADAPEHAATTTDFIHDSGIPNLNRVHFGEKILSLRTLLKRYNFMEVIRMEQAADNVQLYEFVLETLPRYPGYAITPENPSGFDGYNVNQGTFFNWITPMFAGWRGGIRYKYSFVGLREAALRVARDPEGHDTAFWNILDGIGDKFLNNLLESGQGGIFVTPVSQNPCAEVEFPFYSPHRFTTARNLTTDPTFPLRIPHEGERHLLQVLLHPNGVTGADTGRPHIERYVAAGEDFNLFWFQTTVPYYQDSIAT